MLLSGKKRLKVNKYFSVAIFIASLCFCTLLNAAETEDETIVKASILSNDDNSSDKRGGDKNLSIDNEDSNKNLDVTSIVESEANKVVDSDVEDSANVKDGANANVDAEDDMDVGNNQYRIETRIYNRKKYTRIKFYSDDLNIKEMSLVEDKLSIKFSKKIDIDLKYFLEKLGGFISEAVLSDDKEMLSITLNNNNYTTRHFVGGDFLGVDILKSNILDNNADSTISDKNKNDNEAVKSDKENEELTEEKPVEIIKTTPAKPTDISVLRKNINKGIEVIFPLVESTAATVFSRGDRIWMIFNKPYNFDMNIIQGIKFIKNVRPFISGSHTVVEFKLNNKFSTSLINAKRYNIYDYDKKLINIIALREGKHWKLEIAEKIKDDVSLNVVANALEIISGEDEDKKRRVYISIDGADKRFAFEDPVIGDVIQVIPIYQSDTGIDVKRSYVDFEILKTAQGIAIKKISDDVKVEVQKDNVVISSANQLNISSELYTEIIDRSKNKFVRRIRTKLSELKDSSFLPFMQVMKEKEATEGKDKLYTGDLKFEEIKKELFDRLLAINTEERVKVSLANSDEEKKKMISKFEEEKSNARLDIAKFYFAFENYSEALGVIEDIRALDYEFAAGNQEVDIISAASKYLINRYLESTEEFAKLIEESKYDNNSLDEFLLWHWAGVFQQNKYVLKNTSFEIPISYSNIYQKFLKYYPKDLVYKIGLLVVEDYIIKNDVDKAADIFSILSSDPPENMKNNIAYYQALIAEMKDDFESAERIWEKLSLDVEDRRNRARSTFALTKLRLLHGKISVDEAVKIFNSLSIVWRGDNFEFDLLNLIGQLYIKDGRYMEGLKAWHILVKSFPRSKKSIYVAGKMKKYFVELFDKGEAYKLEPFDALSLFFEFRELTPVGKKGDRMIRKLVKHFIDADLLDNATALLHHQVKFRTSGIEQVKLAIKLAKLHLINKKPLLAIEAVDFINSDNADEKYIKQSKYIIGKSHVMLDNYKETLELLQDDFTKEAQNLRLDLFTKKKNWFGVINIIEGRLEKYKENAPLDLKPRELKDIVLLSIAYASQNMKSDILELKKEFAERIGRKNMREVFGFMTEEMKSINNMNFDKTVQLDDIETFMNDYMYWPKKDWKNIIKVLKEKVKRYKAEITREQEQDIIKLAIAYSEITKEGGGEGNKDLQKDFSNFLKEFKNVKITRNTIHAFGIFDDVYFPMDHNAIFDKKISLRDTASFVDKYKSVRKISDLNALLN